MKKAIALSVAAIMLMALCTACSTAAQDEAIVTQFLQDFYTIDKPDEALKDLAIVDKKGEPEAYIELIKDKFLKYFTNVAFLFSSYLPSGWTSIQEPQYKTTPLHRQKCQLKKRMKTNITLGWL